MRRISRTSSPRTRTTRTRSRPSSFPCCRRRCWRCSGCVASTSSPPSGSSARSPPARGSRQCSTRAAASHWLPVPRPWGRRSCSTVSSSGNTRRRWRLALRARRCSSTPRSVVLGNTPTRAPHWAQACSLARPSCCAQRPPASSPLSSLPRARSSIGPRGARWAWPWRARAWPCCRSSSTPSCTLVRWCRATSAPMRASSAQDGQRSACSSRGSGCCPRCGTARAAAGKPLERGPHRRGGAAVPCAA